MLIDIIPDKLVLSYIDISDLNAIRIVFTMFYFESVLLCFKYNKMLVLSVKNMILIDIIPDKLVLYHILIYLT